MLIELHEMWTLCNWCSIVFVKAELILYGRVLGQSINVRWVILP